MAAPSAAVTSTPYRPGIVLVGFREGVSVAKRLALEARAGVLVARSLGVVADLTRRGQALRRSLGTELKLSVPRGDVLRVVRRLRRDRKWVRFAEPDYLLRASGVDNVPNDPSFSLQWGSLNTGQNVNGITGAAGADDRAAAAWNATTGNRAIVIGEVDTGVDYNHPDLAANIWSNPGGIGGCPAGTHGYNVVAGTCNPMDDDTAYGGHGTHVAGIMGAMGNNGTGVAGMNWATTILPVKWLDSNAWGATDQLISALDWVLKAQQAGVNVRVVNDSATFVGTAFSQALSDEIDLLGANNILFVTAAGNTGQDDDNPQYTRYPCGYDRPTEICVTATNQSDQLPSWANWGVNTVDLAAPGDNIYSTLRNGTYGYISGGSMASATVSGAAALILSADPLSTTALKADILSSVDPLPALAGLVRTGGRLDVCNAIPACAGPRLPTFGTTTVGGSVAAFSANRKLVNQYSVPSAGTLSKLSVYLAPTKTSGTASIEGVIYADAGGAPGALLGTTGQLTFSNKQSSGWYDLPFGVPVPFAAGTYWIGVLVGGVSGVASVRYQTVAGSRDYNNNAYSAGPSSPFGSVSSDSVQMSLYATYTPGGGGGAPPAPVNTAAPAISGSARSGQTLNATTGTWSGGPTSFSYAWERCNSAGTSCNPISGATASSYTVAAGDVGSTLVVAVTAVNAGGSSAPASSAPTAVVAAGTGTFGATAIGSSSDTFAADRKRVNSYSLAIPASVSKLSIYLAPTGTSGTQNVEGLIYADAGGAPGALLGTTRQLTFSSTGAAGWYDLTFASPVGLAAGKYWIGVITGASSGVAGFRYNSVSGSRDYNANAYTSGPTSSFGSVTTDSEQMSQYATYTPS